MATVLRVKRRNDDEPLDALVIAVKRRKTEAGSSSDAAGKTPLTAVVKFAGTLENQEDDVVEHLHKTLSKDELKANYKQHVVDVANKARLKTQEASRANRYKVLNCNRSINAGQTDDKDERIMTVIDVEDSVSCAVLDTPDPEKEIGYVYDVYYTQTEEDMHLDDDLSIHPFEQELVFDPFRENGAPDDEEHESDDSNSESNWRNDYPDSDHSENSVDDEDMQEAVRKLKIDGESSDLSSDEEDFVYAVDEGDVESFGYDYAKYKARVKEEIDDDEDSNKSERSQNSELSDDGGTREDDDD